MDVLPGPMRTGENRGGEKPAPGRESTVTLTRLDVLLSNPVPGWYAAYNECGPVASSTLLNAALPLTRGTVPKILTSL
jgi:hypothetical protein